jgi:hypothetical protein
VRQASCEAIHRAVTTRGEDLTGYGLKADHPDLKQRICDVVEMAHERSMERLLLREIDRHGYISGGWSARWPTAARFTERSHSAPPEMRRESVDPTAPLRALVGPVQPPEHGSDKKDRTA